jgi:hypothetical protein
MTRCLLALVVALVEIVVWVTVEAAEWPAEKIGPKDVWSAATDRVTQSRFIPMQLIVPGVWDGTRRIDLPKASGGDAEGLEWTGPLEWRDPHTGQTLTVYDRHRTTKREGSVEQKMAVRTDGSAMGRVYDSRRGGSVCHQEAKFPLGVWKQGEIRTYDYVCLRARDGQVQTLRRTARITIEELDYEYNGTAHSLRIAWRYSDSTSGAIIDHRTYIFSPGRGLVAHLSR